MHKGYLRWATILGALAVILGAFGAHALRQSAPADSLSVYETGVRYQIYHSLALLMVSSMFRKLPSRFLRWSANCFIAGIIIFSGSLYLIVILKVVNGPSIGPLGIVTPIGGAFLISGWICLLASSWKKY